MGVERTGARARAQVYVLVFLAVLAAFFPALRNEFVNLDDDVNLLQNEHYRGLGAENLRWMFGTFYVGHYMPITWLSLALDYLTWGLDPLGYHLTSILLHAGSAAVLAAVFFRLLTLQGAPSRPKLYAAAAGALFHSLHPLRVESVAWATERRDVLAGLFFTLAVHAYLRRTENEQRRASWLAASLVFFALSLLSKASGMTLPLVLLALDLLQPARDRGGRREWLEKLPYFALGIAGAILGWLGQIHSTQAILPLAEFGPLQRLAQASYAMVFYLKKTLWPSGLAPLYLLDRDLDPFAARYVFSAAFLLATTLGAWLLRRWVPAVLAAWVAYLLLIAPFSGIAQAGSQFAADRYTYLAAIPLGALFAAACSKVFSRAHSAAYLVVAILIVALAVLTARQCAHWRNSMSLWRHVVEVEPSSDLGHHRLGVSLHQEGRFTEALSAYDQALLLRPEPDDSNARYDRALTLLALERIEEAQAELELVLAAKPSHAAALEVAADLLQRRGESDRAIALYQEALAFDPQFVEGYLALARRLRSSVRPAEAREAIERGLLVAPRNAPLRNQLGVLLLEQGNAVEAELHFRAALSFDPDEPGYLTNLGTALEKLGRIEEAKECWRRAIAVEPRHNAARRLLERATRGEP